MFSRSFFIQSFKSRQPSPSQKSQPLHPQSSICGEGTLLAIIDKLSECSSHYRLPTVNSLTNLILTYNSTKAVALQTQSEEDVSVIADALQPYTMKDVHGDERDIERMLKVWTTEPAGDGKVY